ncbi:DUF202 domain-containing protein [Chitinimonas arctica]|uniref:DUF202 domain-containing protein n=1 Tax=Chitinimonas arctica TaxID=2594795 RepID=A0A516SF08_9NEIS|nr:DUF202 domain-containing protein [Chitinimonas arctica]QDQ26746.1 DUF202 domain-containing protein [Chitinimonas arctica]
MLSRLGRVALLIALGLLLWNFFLKPQTRQRFRGHMEILAYALLASSVLMLIWHWWGMVSQRAE